MKILTSLLLILGLIQASLCGGPLVVATWLFSKNATQAAWNALQSGSNAVDTLVAGCSYCETTLAACGYTVGFGGSPDESGETTLDAMIYDGKTMDVGAVGDLRRVKNAVGVAKHVLQNTHHSLLTGDQATDFALALGFQEESLSSDVSTEMWSNWTQSNCQPNYWRNVEPDPETSCGPYKPLSENSIHFQRGPSAAEIDIHETHDTVGMLVLDFDNNVVAGTTTNGLRHKIPGRVGDSPIAGSGAYADNEVGGAVATGNGDIMLRFSPSFLAVEEMRRGATPMEAAEAAVARIAKHYPSFSGAVLAIDINGQVGAACNFMETFPFSVVNPVLGESTMFDVMCTNIGGRSS